MEASVQNLLYRKPELYELIYPEPDEATPLFCLRLFERYSLQPSSILDVGCGTGRDLNVLSRTCKDCWGVDYLPEMIAYARRMRPHLHLEIGDMRKIRLGRKFDAILCLGSVLMYAITQDEIEATLSTFAAHARKGSLLILDMNNSVGYLPGGSFKESIEYAITTSNFTAKAVATFSFDRRAQLLIRKRIWDIPGEPSIEDFCRFRMFFPSELEYLLGRKRFRVVDMFDNKELRHTELTGGTLYVAAIFDA